MRGSDTDHGFFQENVREDGDTLNRFCDALQNEDSENVEKIFAEYLRKTISIRDTAVRTDMKENLQNGLHLLLGGRIPSCGKLS